MTDTQIVAEPEGLIEIQLEGVPLDELEEWLETMLLIREFEESLEPLTTSGSHARPICATLS